jgi:hypothetical protein
MEIETTMAQTKYIQCNNPKCHACFETHYTECPECGCDELRAVTAELTPKVARDALNYLIFFERLDVAHDALMVGDAIKLSDTIKRLQDAVENLP